MNSQKLVNNWSFLDAFQFSTERVLIKNFLDLWYNFEQIDNSRVVVKSTIPNCWPHFSILRRIFFIKKQRDQEGSCF